jgi:hypothetical protein
VAPTTQSSDWTRNERQNTIPVSYPRWLCHLSGPSELVLGMASLCLLAPRQAERLSVRTSVLDFVKPVLTSGWRLPFSNRSSPGIEPTPASSAQLRLGAASTRLLFTRSSIPSTQDEKEACGKHPRPQPTGSRGWMDEVLVASWRGGPDIGWTAVTRQISMRSDCVKRRRLSPLVHPTTHHRPPVRQLHTILDPTGRCLPEPGPATGKKPRTCRA